MSIPTRATRHPSPKQQQVSAISQGRITDLRSSRAATPQNVRTISITIADKHPFAPNTSAIKATAANAIPPFLLTLNQKMVHPTIEIAPNTRREPLAKAGNAYRHKLSTKAPRVKNTSARKSRDGSIRLGRTSQSENRNRKMQVKDREKIKLPAKAAEVSPPTSPKPFPENKTALYKATGTADTIATHARATRILTLPQKCTLIASRTRNEAPASAKPRPAPNSTGRPTPHEGISPNGTRRAMASTIPAIEMMRQAFAACDWRSCWESTRSSSFALSLSADSASPKASNSSRLEIPILR